MMVSSARAQAMIGTRAGRSSSLLDAASASNTVTQERLRRAFGDTRQLAFDLSAPPQARGAGQPLRSLRAAAGPLPPPSLASPLKSDSILPLGDSESLTINVSIFRNVSIF